MSGARNNNTTSDSIKKTTLCRFMSSKSGCKNGKLCKFSHNVAEVENWRLKADLSPKELIKEEIKNILELETAPAAAPAAAPKTATEVKKLTDYLGGVGKTALTQINQPAELDSVLNAIFNGMNPAFQKNAKAVAIKKVIDMKLSV